jgi:hypothetical protein
MAAITKSRNFIKWQQRIGLIFLIYALNFSIKFRIQIGNQVITGSCEPLVSVDI